MTTGIPFSQLGIKSPCAGWKKKETPSAPTISEQEEVERTKEICIGCSGTKEIGCVVCWSCFKDGKLPFKYFNGSLQEWIQLRKAEGRDPYIERSDCYFCGYRLEGSPMNPEINHILILTDDQVTISVPCCIQCESSSKKRRAEARIKHLHAINVTKPPTCHAVDEWPTSSEAEQW